MLRRNVSLGFTIIELLIVIAVISILVALTIVGFNGVQQSVRDKSLISDGEAVAVLVTRYSTHNAGALGGAVAWYSAGTANPNYSFTPSSGNVVDVVANSTDYCIRVYNPSSHKKTIAEAQTKESSTGVCATLSPSVAAGGTLTCPTGFVTVPGNSLFSTSDFCVMKYEAKDVGGVATSQASGAPWGGISQTAAASAALAACSGCHLLTEKERMTIAHNILVQASNWTSGVVGTGSLYVGANDSSPTTPQAASADDNDGYSGTGNSSSSGANQRRTFTLSNGQVIWDFAGNIWEWSSNAVTSNQPGGSGWAYTEWNAISSMGGLPTTIKPSYGNGSAAAWTTTQGLGGIYSNNTDTTTRGFIWGGGTNQFQGTNGGIFNLGLSEVPSSTWAMLGFRVTK